MGMKARDELIKIVEKLEIFRDLSEEEGLHILGMCQRRAFIAGEIVWRPGDPGVDMLVLITGELHVTNADGKMICKVLPGASFGEMACLSGHQRFVGFQAVESSTALSLSRKSLQELGDTLPRLYHEILETTIGLLAHRISRTGDTAVVAVQDGQPCLW